MSGSRTRTIITNPARLLEGPNWVERMFFDSAPDAESFLVPWPRRKDIKILCGSTISLGNGKGPSRYKAWDLASVRG